MNSLHAVGADLQTEPVLRRIEDGARKLASGKGAALENKRGKQSLGRDERGSGIDLSPFLNHELNAARLQMLYKKSLVPGGDTRDASGAERNKINQAIALVDEQRAAMETKIEKAREKLSAAKDSSVRQPKAPLREGSREQQKKVPASRLHVQKSH